MNNQKGFSLTEVAVVGLIIGVVGLIAASTMQMTMQQWVKSNTVQGVSDVQRVILNAIENEESFKRTIKHVKNQAAFDCLLTGKDCTGAGGDIAVYRYNANSGSDELIPYTDPGPSIGFTAKGQPCNTFSPLGNDECPFKYTVSWTAYCSDNQNIKGAASVETRCFNPLIDVRGQLQFAPTTPSKFPPMNVQSLSMRVMKSQQESHSSTLCTMIAGSAPVGSNCILAGAVAGATSCIGRCGPNVQALVSGVDPDGSLRCTCAVVGVEKNCNTTANPFGKVLLGIDTAGNIICGDGLLPKLIANGSINNPAAAYSGGY